MQVLHWFCLQEGKKGACKNLQVDKKMEFKPCHIKKTYKFFHIVMNWIIELGTINKFQVSNTNKGSAKLGSPFSRHWTLTLWPVILVWPKTTNMYNMKVPAWNLWPVEHLEARNNRTCTHTSMQTHNEGIAITPPPPSTDLCCVCITIMPLYRPFFYQRHLVTWQWPLYKR